MRCIPLQGLSPLAMYGHPFRSGHGWCPSAISFGAGPHRHGAHAMPIFCRCVPTFFTHGNGKAPDTLRSPFPHGNGEVPGVVPFPRRPEEFLPVLRRPMSVGTSRASGWVLHLGKQDSPTAWLPFSGKGPPDSRSVCGDRTFAEGSSHHTDPPTAWNASAVGATRISNESLGRKHTFPPLKRRMHVAPGRNISTGTPS